MREPRNCLILVFILMGLMGCNQTSNEPQVPNGPMVLDYNFGGNPSSLDPAFAVDSVSLDVMAQLFEGLTSYDSKRAEVVPALAEDWDVSQDGFTYTFKLRENVKWINQAGQVERDLTASDVVYAIKRACHPDTKSPSTHILFTIEGCQEAQAEAVLPDLERIGVRALTPLIVEFTLEDPVAYFPIIMSMPVARPVPEEVVSAHGQGWTAREHLLTNGAYFISAWQPGTELTLLKNEHYYLASEVAIVRVNGYMLDDTKASNLYQSNQLDTISVSPSESQRLRSLGLETQWTPVAQPCTYSYGFTIVKPPLDNVRVRRALSMAIDRQALIERALHGSQIAAHHFAPPFVFGALPLTTLGVSFDLAQSQTLLAEAGYPNGQGFPILRLWSPADDEQKQIASIVAEMWTTHLGIEVIVEYLSREDYLASMQNMSPLQDIPDVWALGWCGDYPDQQDWLYKVFNINVPAQQTPSINGPFAERITIYPGGEHIRRTPSYFDEVTEQASTVKEPEKRKALYAEAEEILTTEEVMIAPLFHYTTNTFTKPWLQRTFSSVAGQSFKDWRIDVLAKEKAR